MNKYVAAKKIKVKDFDGNYVIRNEGDPVPEAAEWSFIYKWLNNGHIRLVPDGYAEKAPEETAPLEMAQAKLEAVPDLVDCPDCDKAFKTRAGMRRHQGAIHKKKK